MDHTKSSLTPLMSKRLTNQSILKLYKKNKDQKSLAWKKKLFNDLYYLINKKNYYGEKDLKQEAALGLWTAIITYDFNKNFDFFRWSKWHINSRIRNYKRANLREKSAINSIKLDSLDTAKPSAIGRPLSMIEFNLSFEKWMKTKRSRAEKRDGKIIADWLFVGNSLTEVARKNNLSVERVRQIRDNELKEFSRFYND